VFVVCACRVFFVKVFSKSSSSSSLTRAFASLNFAEHHTLLAGRNERKLF
jgi:hypothetical protein